MYSLRGGSVIDLTAMWRIARKVGAWLLWLSIGWAIGSVVHL
jgi:hypothetical protein